MVKYLLPFLFISCSFLDKDRNASSELKQIKKDYYEYLEETCVEDKYYDGLRNTFQYNACLVDEKALSMQTDMNRFAFLWSDDLYYEKRSDADKSISKETLLFLSFYSPSRKINDLDKKSTKWKLYISDGERRYAASSIIKMANEYDEIKNLYPAHTHWGTAYEVTFPIAISNLNRANIEFTITSREGFSKKLIPNGN